MRIKLLLLSTIISFHCFSQGHFELKQNKVNVDTDVLAGKIILDKPLKDQLGTYDAVSHEVRYYVVLFIDGQRMAKYYDNYSKDRSESEYNKMMNATEIDFALIPDERCTDLQTRGFLKSFKYYLQKIPAGVHKCELKFTSHYKKNYIFSVDFEMTTGPNSEARIDELLNALQSNVDNENAVNRKVPKAKMTNVLLTSKTKALYKEALDKNVVVIITDADWSVQKNSGGTPMFKYINVTATWEENGVHYMDFNKVAQDWDGYGYSGRHYFRLDIDKLKYNP